ncbi:MAG: type VI secretion protein [Gammaproteobacteria bacterium]|nr:MAG: type VI secretion protein [Gammaproteobacteria bacterium]
MSDEAVEIDPVFLAMTRPPIFMGVTYTFFVINGTLTTIVFLAANNLLAFVIGIPVHMVGYLVCLKDPRIFDIWRVRLLKTPTCRNRGFWNASSYAP